MLALTVALGGCAGNKATQVADAEATAEPVFPADAMDRYARALGWMDAGDDARAAGAFRELAADYPDYAGPLVNLAILESRAGNTEAGINLLSNAVVICDQCAPAWNQLGILLRRQGRFEEAESAYLKALAEDPDYALAHYNLGVLYDLYQQQPATAVEHYERYVALTDDVSQLPVDKWIVDLRRRIGAPPTAAQAEGT
ncbi:MAG: tetratricopeptide repeat protein [Chromatiales bacterium]|nr:MAG: tetratricopeptide repeat protein [Chromatiales bacterium]